MAFWTGCRETFHRQYGWTPYGKSKKMAVFHFNPCRFDSWGWDKSDAIKLNIARLFWYVERRMGWHERTAIHHMRLSSSSNVDHYIHFRLSSGWFQNSVALSLATALMRLGPYCRPKSVETSKNFDKLLESTDITRNTKRAIYRFLDGYQHYRGADGCQWADTFVRKSKKEVEECLIARWEVEMRARHFWEVAGSPCPTGDPKDFWAPYWLQACSDFRNDFRNDFRIKI